MNTTQEADRLVIVHGPSEPLLDATLTLVALEPVWHGNGVTVWAPASWNASWLSVTDQWGDGCAIPADLWFESVPPREPWHWPDQSPGGYGGHGRAPGKESR